MKNEVSILDVEHIIELFIKHQLNVLTYDNIHLEKKDYTPTKPVKQSSVLDDFKPTIQELIAYGINPDEVDHE
jgi:hypothetical protein